MAVSIAGIAVNIIMVVIIIILIVLGVTYNNDLKTCEQEQSPFCYAVQCPCNQLDSSGNPAAPCFGYAQVDLGNGTFRCSSDPASIVDASGNPVT